MNYPINNFPLDSYTNYLINKQMNYFIKNLSTSKIYVLDYKDDLLSLICYRILKNLQEVSPSKFNLFLYGKKKKTKSFLVKKEKFVNSFWLKKKIKQDLIIFISPFNPLYEVTNSTIIFKDFPCKTLKPIEKFTPEQLLKTREFFNLEDVDFPEEENVNSFSSFCKRESTKTFEQIPKLKYNSDITLVKLTKDNERDQDLLNLVEDSNGLIFYYFEGNELPPMLQGDYSLYVTNKANIPFSLNINNNSIPQELIQNGCYPTFIGNWSLKERGKFLEKEQN